MRCREACKGPHRCGRSRHGLGQRCAIQAEQRRQEWCRVPSYRSKGSMEHHCCVGGSCQTGTVRLGISVSSPSLVTCVGVARKGQHSLTWLRPLGFRLDWVLFRKARRVGRVRHLIRLVFLEPVAAHAAGTFAVAADAPGMTTDESSALFSRLLGERLDVLVPRKHGLVAFSAEDPAVALVHAAGLAAFQHELGARRTRL